MAVEGTLLMEDAELRFRNFAGKEGQYNAEGDRNFCVFLDPGLAEQLAQDGWNVKHLKVREPGDIPQAYLQVSIKYRGKNGSQVRPPIIQMVTSKGRTPLGEDECEVLDWVEIAKVDLIIRPYEWAVSGKSGVKAYLKTIYVTIREDALEMKYNQIPEVGQQLAIEASDEANDIWDGEIVEETEQLAIER